MANYAMQRSISRFLIPFEKGLPDQIIGNLVTQYAI